MSSEKDLSTEGGTTTEEVIKFLKENPDFFTKNADLLADLNFVHDTKGGAISLIQRQVELLRTHLSQNRERLVELARNAKHNESLLKRFQELCVALASAEDHNHTLTILQRTICLEFGLSLLEVVVVEDTWKDPSKQIVELTLQEFREFSNSIYNIPIYLGKTPAKLRETVLSEKNELARSIALIKINYSDHEGYVLIGSKDENHFQNDMGTEFVTFIGAYVNAVLSRFI